MLMSRIRLRPEASQKPEYWRLFSGAYAAHKTAWKFFTQPAGAPRPFLYRVEQGNGADLCMYMVSADVPVDPVGVFTVESKEYAPALAVGERVLFQVRVNPVVKRTLPGQKQGKRHDVVMDAKHRAKLAGAPVVTNDELVAEAGWEWLAGKERLGGRDGRAGTHGFSVERKQVRFSGYQQVETGKTENGHQARISVLDMEGLCTVTDAARFQKVLLEGLGAAKGFGCGLMMVKRA